MNQYCVGICFTWMYLLEMQQGGHHYIYIDTKPWYELMNWQVFSLHYHPDYLGDWLG
jgi:hypothetical protein